MIPEVAPLDPIDLALGAFNHDDGADRRATEQGVIDVLFERYIFTATHPFVSGNHGAAIGIKDPVAQGVGRKPAEDD
ncbi:hypothetical protein D3C72_2362520 [compost metagenome]